MKTKLLLIAILCSSVTSLIAQNNVIKLAPLKVVTMKSLHLSYERVIIPKLSVELNASYMIPGQIPFLQIEGFDDLQAKGVMIPPEVRFYPNLKETPRGFFLAGHFKFYQRNLSAGYDFETNFMGNTYNSNMDATADISGFGGGISIGTQWLVADRVALEVQWFGIGWTNNNVQVDLEGQLPTGATWQELENDFGDDVENILSFLPTVDNINTYSTPNSAGVKTTMGVPNIRFMQFKVGVAF